MLHTIVVPLDGSGLAEKALACAERMAAKTSARLVLIRLVPFDVLRRPEDDLDLADEARAYLAWTASTLTKRGCLVTTIVDWGQPAERIIQEAQAQQADLIVMGTHGRTAAGRVLYGSVADAVMRASSVPVILVPPNATVPDQLSRILVPLDGSDLAEAVLPKVVTLAPELVLVDVVPLAAYSFYDEGTALSAFDVEVEIGQARHYLTRVAERLEKGGVRVHTRIEVAKPEVTIAAVAAQEQVSLIAMATHGRSGLSRLVLGSVATATLQHTMVPVLLIGPAELDAESAHIENMSLSGAPQVAALD